jgi:Fe(3+) dicitrate transport protein
LQVQQPDPENPTIIELVTLRTNIGDARVLGFESLVEWDIINCFAPKNKAFGLSIFSNFALLDGRYIRSDNSFASGKKLELLAPLTLKSGLNLSYKNFRFSWQYSFTSTHFSDATNSETTANAVVGRIPSYNIMDASVSYSFRWFRIQAGVNNLMDEFYFTRRATSYPGPGILPADGRNFYVGLRTEIKTKKK